MFSRKLALQIISMFEVGITMHPGRWKTNKILPSKFTVQTRDSSLYRKKIPHKVGGGRRVGSSKERTNQCQCWNAPYQQVSRHKCHILGTSRSAHRRLCPPLPPHDTIQFSRNCKKDRTSPCNAPSSHYSLLCCPTNLSQIRQQQYNLRVYKD